MTRPTAAAFVTWGLAAGLLATTTGTALAQLRVRPGAAPAAAGTVSLPYGVPDGTGGTWQVYPFGQIQQSGNQPLYSQGAMLNVNGAQPMSQNRQARIDDKTGELVLEGMNANGLAVTRRLLFEKDPPVVRYVDVIKNNTGRDQAVSLTLSSNINFGVQAAQTVPDPKRKGQDVGWVAQTNGNGAVMEVFAGKGAKTAMTISHQQGNNVVTAGLTVAVPTGKEVAVMHLHGVHPSVDAATQFVLKLREQDLLRKMPPDVRKLIVNFPSQSNMVGDLELLRGDALDVVELRGGDQLRGTLKQSNFDLVTFYGPVSLPADRVVALLNVGAFRPRQLVVTTDGQIFGGTLKQDKLDLQLSSGQITKVPLDQVTRAGYRKRPGEPEEWTLDKPMVVMRSGERVAVRPPAGLVEVATRYGKLSLDPKMVSALVLQNEDSGAHQVVLTDGSRFTGLLTADVLEMALDAGGGPDQTVRFPAGAVARVQLGKTAEQDDTAAVVRLANDDLLVGHLTGQIKVDTAFDTLTLNAAEIRELRRPPGTAAGGSDVQVTLFDGSTVGGQPQDPDLSVELAGGLTMRVPLALLEEYVQPQPSPGKETEARIAELVKNLSADDWKARDRAQQGLTNLGPVAAGTLRKLRAGQSAEAQQRIDSILKELDKLREKEAGNRPAGGGAGAQPPVFLNKE
ncbi:MAG: hypothetical protein JWO31_2767 [Phycisphaerales bacterium]|nr:hypothetical protein [Phycisphaerales bacterium]